MLRAKELQISFKFNNIDTKKTKTELKITDMLEDKFTVQVASALRKLNIFLVNQLINKEGNRMISWQQLKLLRKKSSKGRPARWFKRIEEIMLEDKSSRQLKPEFRLPEENKEFSLQTTLDRCSNDNRKKEWVVLKSSRVAKEENLVIRKIVANTPKKVLTEHWKTKLQENKTGKLLEKCNGCNLDQIREQKSCKKWSNREDIQGSLSRLISKKEVPKLEVEQEMIRRLDRNKLIKPSKHESPVKEIVCEDLDVELIKKQRFSQVLKEELIQKNEENKLRINEVLIFYTDGSLKKSAIENTIESEHMGIGWVQVDGKEEKVIDKGTIGA
jgi:hypothetical protein